MNKSTQKNGIYSYPCKKFPRGIAYGIKYTDKQGRQHKQGGFERKSDAEKERARIIADMNIGRFVDPQRGKATINEIGTAWLAGRKGVIKQAAYDKYESLWHCHVQPKWGNIPVANILHSNIQQWVGELSSKLGYKQVRAAVSVLRMILTQAVKDKCIPDNPCDDIQLPREKIRESHVYLTMPQLLQLGKAARNRKSGNYETMILFMGTTGMRFGETTALRVKNIDFKHGTVYVCENAVWSSSGLHVNTAKNGDDRTVVFPRQLLGEKLRKVCEFKDPDALVFERPNSINDGRHLTKNDYMRPPDDRDGWFIASVKEAGLPKLTPHSLRHTAVSIAVHAGAPPKVVQRIAGHKTLTMTLDYYADLLVDDLYIYGDLMDKEAKKAMIQKTLENPENFVGYQNSTKMAFTGKQKSAGTLEFQRFSWQSPSVPPERVEDSPIAIEK